MSAEQRWIRSLCVLGGGITGFSAALAFARALPRVQVRLIATPADPAALADRPMASLPAIHRFHAAIGIDELELVRDGCALHHLGTRFNGWSASGESWFHVFGDHGLAADGVPFHQIWAKLRATRQVAAFDRFAAAARLAEAGKFVHPEDDPASPLSTYLYGLRFEPKAYLERLVAQAGKHGVDVVEGEYGDAVRRDDGGIAAIRLKDGRAFEADLFIDCSGPCAPLRSAVDSAWEDWSAWLPCDRLLVATGERNAVPAPSDQVFAVADGWHWESALPDRLAVGFAWNSAVTEDQRAADQFEAWSGVPVAEKLTIRVGRRPEPWKRNVLAIGDSAVAIDPLHSAGLHLAQSAILRALELLPGRDCHPLELSEYNRRTALETDRVRDFQALHYLRSGRTEGEFWKRASAQEAPASLAHSLDQFEARGRLPFHDEESFEAQSWLAVLLGMGVMPRRIDPSADRVNDDQAAAAMAGLAERLERLPDRLPAYRDYLARMTGKARP